MKHINDLITNPQQSTELNTTSSAAKESEQSEILVETLWGKLSAMYGYKFLSQFGEEPDKTWETCLKGITGRQMADGLNHCLTHHLEWPPGAAQFRGLCLGQFIDADGNDSSWQHAGAAYKQFESTKLIESDEITSKRKKAGKSALSDMKKLL